MYQRRAKNQSISHLVMHQRSIRCSSFQTRLMEIAACLVNANQHVSFLANKDGISPLYLAVLAGNVSLVNAMLNVQGKTSDLASQLEGRKSLVHAALKAKNTGLLANLVVQHLIAQRTNRNFYLFVQMFLTLFSMKTHAFSTSEMKMEELVSRLEHL